MFLASGHFNRLIESRLGKALVAYTIVCLMFLQSIPLNIAYAEETEGAPIEEEIASEEEVVSGELSEETEEPISEDETANENNEETTGQEQGGGVVIETGDADADTDLNNGANVNDTNIEGVEGSGTTTPSGDTNITASSTNDGVIGNSSDTGALTGDNHATTTEDTATTTPNTATTTDIFIGTGDASATTNAINGVNVNLLNSTGTIAVVNSEGSGSGYIDLRPLVASSSTSTLPCGADACDGSFNDMSLFVDNTNNATITNDIITNADTGSNSANGSGESFIGTGDASAVTNIVNVANLNAFDANLLLLIMNHAGDFNGELILPNTEFFYEFFKDHVGDITPADIENMNTAYVENLVSTKSDTGNNSVAGGDAAIVTGDAYSGTNILNLINSNWFGGGYFELIVNIAGAWSGTIYNLPDSIEYEETATGFVLRGASGSYVQGGVSGSVTNANSAVIRNVVLTTANTGGNSATGTDAYIETGDAYAQTNIVNVANTNIYGENWLTALFNIGGDWNGYIAFGEPDLWIGAEANSNVAPNEGDAVVYKLTIANYGDATAHDVKLDAYFNEPLMYFDYPETEWDELMTIGDLEAGETKTVTYNAVVGDLPDETDTEVETAFALSAYEPDANPDNNTESLYLTLFGPRHEENAAKKKGTKDPSLEIKKTADKREVTASSTIDYTVTVFNRSNHGKAINGELVDILRDENGTIISEQRWDLGTIYEREEVIVTYTTEFGPDIKPGKYTNTARINSQNGAFNIEDSVTIKVIGDGADAQDATVIMTNFERSDVPQVLGVSISSTTVTQYDPPTKVLVAVPQKGLLSKLASFMSSFFGRLFEEEDRYTALFAASIYFAIRRKPFKQDGKGVNFFLL